MKPAKRKSSISRITKLIWVMASTSFLLLPGTIQAASLAEHTLELPSWSEIWRVLTLQDYNTRVVVIGTTLLGLAAGLAGTFLLLRKRALLSDALSHATLPGIALTFILITFLGGEGKNLIWLIIGAAVFSVIGTVSVIFIQNYSRIKDDAALGIVLSVFFGFGIALLGLATRMEGGNAAGLSSFIYGKTASMLFFDAVLIAATALGAAIFSMLLFKEFSLLCFDYNYASTQGWPVMRLDLLMMTLVVIVTVIGLQAVGLILVVALLIIPPSAARFWTHRLSTMLMISGFFGALSGLFGSAFSALMANLPAGAIIVLVAAMIFLFSLTFGSASGLVRHFIERRQLTKKIGRENLLREIFEFYETQHIQNGTETEKTKPSAGIGFAALKIARAWSDRQLRGIIRSAIRAGLVRVDNGEYGLTERGMLKAYEIVRKHRLWEAYLITHADIAPSQVDWGADAIEHVLDRKMIQELENKLPQLKNVKMPTSPHELAISQAVG